MHQLEQSFRLLVKGVTDYAIFMLDLDGQVITWNIGAHRIKGYAADEILGEHFSRFYTEEDRATGKPARALKEAREIGHFVDEGWRVRKDGSRFYASVVLSSVYDEHGTLIGFAKITRDITQKRELEETLKSTQKELFHAQKLQAIGNITKGIAHDFNNLLANISGNLELAQRYGAADPNLVRVLGRAQTAAKRAASMIHHLMMFVRRQPVVPEKIDLVQSFADTAMLFQQAVKANVSFIGFDVDVSPDVKPIMADPRELELALLNVIMNARDAMPNGGTVRIEACNATKEKLPKGLVGEFVKIVVDDDGEGIPEDILSRVIEPWFTTKDVGKGSGLGLSQADGFASQSGGALVIKSQVGVGTSLTFFLPTAD